MEGHMTGHSSKPGGHRLLTVTEFRIPRGVPRHLRPTSKPKRRTETANQQCGTHCACECVCVLLTVSQRQKICQLHIAVIIIAATNPTNIAKMKMICLRSVTAAETLAVHNTNSSCCQTLLLCFKVEASYLVV